MPSVLEQQVAVIGMGCRFAGASSPEELWDLLLRGVDATSDVPASRFDAASYYSEVPATPGKMVSARGGFVSRVDEFDAAFFGIGEHEAERLDPQHRLLLMTAFEALEDAGQAPDRIAATRTGVFVGQNNADAWDLQHRRGVEDFDVYSFTGMHQRSLASGRLSYAFDLRGPSVTVDTACASSLSALHLACMSLRSGDSTMALVAGVNLVLTPHTNIMCSQVRMISPDGKCKFGDDSADGFVRAEGAGVLVLKPLAAALADGDPVRAVIRGSAASNDGRSKPILTAPSVAGQVLAMRWAYENAGISPADVDYVEAHGTGTRIDLVELAALAEVVGAGRTKDQSFLVGSIKTNIGHTEAAAGVAGTIKTVLCLENATVPPSLHFKTPHSKVDWKTLPLEVVTETRPLPNRGRPTIAAVTGQGLSSTNVHIVLSQLDPVLRRASTPPAAARAHLLLLSGKTDRARDDLARAYLDFLAPGARGRALALRDIAHTAATRREHHASRLAVVGATHDELVTRLQAHLAEGRRQPALEADAPARHPRGAQWGLLESAARLYEAGQPLVLMELLEPGGVHVRLPRYPWQLSRHGFGGGPARMS